MNGTRLRRRKPHLALATALLAALAGATACTASAGGEDGSTDGPEGGAVAAGEAVAGGAAEASAGAVQAAPDLRPGEALVIFGADTVVAEVARTPAERERGLMDREEVPDGTGMLFVFEEEAPRAFWMKDTYVALDIAYINADLRIVSIHQMEPLDTNTYPSGAPAMFALEVRRGWFAEQGIEVGDVAELVFGG